MKGMALLLVAMTCLALAVAGCGPTAPAPTSVPPTQEKGAVMAFELTSSAFAHEQAIPQKYSCDGENVSPPLAWSEPPAGAQSFALICEDPDAPAGIWVHWILYNIPAEARSLPEGVPATVELADGSLHGKNGWSRMEYGGPCPPGGTHRYFFKLYALDALLDLPAGASKEQLTQAMERHALGQAELMGTYTR